MNNHSGVEEFSSRTSPITRNFLAGNPVESVGVLRDAFAAATADPRGIVPLLDGIFGRAGDILADGNIASFKRLADAVDNAAAMTRFTAESESELIRAAAYQIGGLIRLKRWLHSATEAGELAFSLGNDRRKKIVLLLLDNPRRWAELRKDVAPTSEKALNPNTLAGDLRDLEAKGLVRQLPVSRGPYVLTRIGYKVANHLRGAATERKLRDVAARQNGAVGQKVTLQHTNAWGGVTLPVGTAA